MLSRLLFSGDYGTLSTHVCLTINEQEQTTSNLATVTATFERYAAFVNEVPIIVSSESDCSLCIIGVSPTSILSPNLEDPDLHIGWPATME